jgi:hypothetical protein
MIILLRTIDKVDATMSSVNEQRELANEVAEAISNPVYGNMDIDEVGGVNIFDSLRPLTPR